MKMVDAFLPSIILNETHLSFYRQKSVISEAVSRIANDGFYKKVELPDIPDAAERKQILDIVTANNIAVTQWMSMVLVYADKQGLNLSSVDETLRKLNVI